MKRPREPSWSAHAASAMPYTVDTHVPYGNACDILVDGSGDVPVVSFAADPHGGPECLWFCFRMIGNGPARHPQVKLVLKHCQNMLGAGRAEALRPVIRAEGEDWQRLPAGRPERLHDGRALISWTLEAPDTFADIATCYPYGMEEVRALVDETGGVFRADTIGVSQLARPIVRLSNNPGAEGGTRPGLYIVARQHSGETSGSWVLDGLLRQMATLGADAPLIWCVPLSNIDGVEQGDYGKDNFPYDLNRAWGHPPMRHETLLISRDLNRWRKRCRPVLGLDFHAPGGTEHDGFYTYLPDPDEAPEPHRIAGDWAAACAEKLTRTYAAESFARVARYRSRWETPSFTRFCCESCELCGITFEIPYSQAGATVLTRERYREGGRRIAEAIVEKISQE